MIGLNVAQKHDFITQQFAAQRRHYRTRIAHCLFAVIEHRGVAVGRLYLAEGNAQFNIVDIALLPTVRGEGLGTAIIAAVCMAADKAGKGVGLFVDRDNRAQRLYQRLEFAACRETAFHIEMERPARVS
jgi:predicted GNAT family acetyltransferase